MVARPTTWRYGSFGATGAPPIWTSSQSSAVHVRGRRPLRSTSQRESPSTAPRFTNAPPHVAWRKTSTPNGGRLSTGRSAARATRSSCASERFDCAGNAAPVHLDGAIGRLELRERPLDGAILDGDRRDGGHREHRGGDGDPGRDEHRARRVRAEAREREADGDEAPLDRAAAASPGVTARSVGGDSARSGRLRPRRHSRELRAASPRMQPPTAPIGGVAAKEGPARRPAPPQIVLARASCTTVRA